MKKYSLLLFSFFILGCATVFANIDSLRSPSNPILEAKLFSLIETSKSLIETSPELAAVYSVDAVKIAKEFGFIEAEAEASKILGMIYYHLSRYNDALKSFNRALTLYNEYKDDKSSAEIITLIGDSYFKQKRYENAITSYMEALGLYSSFSDTANIAIIYSKIGNNYLADARRNFANYDKALKYFEDALKLQMKPALWRNYAETKSFLGKLYLEQGKNDAAREAYESALEIYIEREDYQKAAEIYNSIGNAKYSVGDIEGAIDNYNTALEYYNSVRNEGYAETLYNLSKVYHYLGYNKDWDYRNYEQPMENSKKAYDYLIRYVRLKDSLYNAASVKRFAESLIQSKNIELSHLIIDTTRKGEDLFKTKEELDIEQLKSERYFAWIIFILIALLFTILAIWLIYNRYKLKKKFNEELQVINNEIAEANNKLKISEAGLKESNATKDIYLSIINSDLDKAAKYVKSLLPPQFSDESLSANWIFQPSTQLGGDMFGYHWLDKDNFAFYLLDVSGHGIGPALHAVSVNNIIRSSALKNTDFHHPAKVLKSLNDTFQMDDYYFMYFTMFYAVYNVADRILYYATAGHPPALLVQNNSNSKKLETENMWVGGDIDCSFVQAQIAIGSEATLYVFSDGAYEIELNDGKMMPVDNFYQMIKNVADKENDISILYDNVLKLTDGKALNDDFSLLRIHFNA